VLNTTTPYTISVKVELTANLLLEGTFVVTGFNVEKPTHLTN
jgi:hypothetical protein